MFDLKPISKQGIAAALSKAERYRLLNEPREAESICRDILAADAMNQDAAVTLLLAITDQFGNVGRAMPQQAEEVLTTITDEYRRIYYSGVICERWAKAQMGTDVPGHNIFETFRRAMDHYERAHRLAEPGNEDAILRWNACARIINQDPGIRPEFGEQEMRAGFEDEVPFR